LLRGDTMSDQKKGMKKHVIAAKEWLGKAEQSFDQENEIKGDLNMMLAQAELQRAQETKTGRITKIYFWAKTVTVAMTAGVILAVGWSSFNHSSMNQTGEHQVNQSRMQVQTADEDQPKNNQKILQAESKQAAAMEPLEQKKIYEDGEKAVAISEPKKIIIAKPVQQSPTEIDVSDNMVTKENSLEVPPVKMQMLMRAAGKTLRGQQ